MDHFYPLGSININVQQIFNTSKPKPTIIANKLTNIQTHGLKGTKETYESIQIQYETTYKHWHGSEITSIEI